MSTTRVMLIACGSFSPPTPMHLRMFEIAKDHLNQIGGYEVIGGIVSPVHDSYGKKGLVSAKHRCAMVKLVLKSSDWIRLSDWECNQDEWSRTVQTLRYHQNYINNYLNDVSGSVNEVLPGWLPDGIRSRKDRVHLKLLCGADLLESFSEPGLWLEEDVEEILGNHGIVVISRSGSNPDRFIFESDLLTQYRKNISLVTNWVPNEVSSTMIRRLLSRAMSVKYLLDDHLIEYIKKQGLFNSSVKYILTPNHNEMIANQNYLNDQYMINLPNDTQIEEMDDADYSSKRSLVNVQIDGDMRSNVFCCGNEATKLKTTLCRPGQAVQVITHSPGTRNNDQSDIEVGVMHENECLKDKRVTFNINRQFPNNSNYLEEIKASIKENRFKSFYLPYR